MRTVFTALLAVVLLATPALPADVAREKDRIEAPAMHAEGAAELPPETPEKPTEAPKSEPPKSEGEGPFVVKKPAGEPAIDEIRKVIESQVEAVLACRQPDGSFVLGSPKGPGPEDTLTLTRVYGQYRLGQTALAVLALQYAQPHLTGDLQTRAEAACREAIAFIVQSPPEPRTYSAGLILTVLCQGNPERYRKVIDAYATYLVKTQRASGDLSGMWGYGLGIPKEFIGGLSDDRWGDNSNTQFALLGLFNAHGAGFQVPGIVWERSAEHYVKTQSPDGGWGYRTANENSYPGMTLAGTISLQLCIEMVLTEGHKQCRPIPRARPVAAGLKWIANNWEQGGKGNMWKVGGVTTDTYALYALERLGILMGRSNVGERDWYAEGARALVNNNNWQSIMGTPEVTSCFGVAFLARGLEPVVINKLERPGSSDWDCDPYDVKHLVEHIRDHYQQSVQWRIVTMEAPLELLLRTPILFINGHEKLSFTGEEKAKLRAYVEGGGTIVGEACCGKTPFADSFRALVKEIFGDGLKPLSARHPLFELMKVKPSQPKPAVECLTLNEQGRPGVLFLPTDWSCRWTVGGAKAREAFEVGAGIYLYVTTDCRKMFLTAHPEDAAKAESSAAPVPAP